MDRITHSEAQIREREKLRNSNKILVEKYEERKHVGQTVVDDNY
jgi:hypothetical protein